MVKAAFSLLLSFGTFFVAVAQNAPKSTALIAETDYKAIQAPLPSFSMETLDGKMIHQDHFPADKPLIVVLFNPTCEHCEDLGKDIVAHKEAFKNIPVVFIAAKDMKPYLAAYINTTGLKQMPETMVGADRSDVIPQIYEYKALPQTNIYNGKHQLIFKHNGSITAKALLSAISQNGQ
ncbi:hypothetical protein DBR32_09075 [Taibaiella sp. KBW10]|uniref:TlpA family protein disulfide reductase n=1 Tax=Taibaiella sp. KBW10 TaxID=2153357 RepID=UPI000F5A3734|nr:hypothetical protein [Taibaiella sp. KBW10]RQO30859.1 hypothetical protein DBR32_09075 [Taibaiella sp. KBW10]